MINRIAVHLANIVLLFSFSATYLYSQKKITREEYIQTYKEWAIEDMKKSGIPASIKLAQAILESAEGNSKLAKEANNHFGIKCHTDWQGQKVYHHDDAKDECFRKYDNAISSFEDHSIFLTTRNRYRGLFSIDPTDYRGWAFGLKEAGYATNPNYPQQLIKIIEDHQLNLFDQEGEDEARQAQKLIQKRMASGTLIIDPYKQREVGYNNGVKYIKVQGNDTFDSITKQFNLRSWEISHYNDLPNNADIKNYRYLYLESKRKKAHPNHSTHIVKEGETMHLISQQYGIRLRRLYLLNNMETGSQPKSGDKLNLRKKIRQ